MWKWKSFMDMENMDSNIVDGRAMGMATGTITTTATMVVEAADERQQVGVGALGVVAPPPPRGTSSSTGAESASGAEGEASSTSSENTWFHRRSSPIYKLVTLAHLTQSALNAVACLIIVCLTNLWIHFSTNVVFPAWKSICATSQEIVFATTIYNQQQQQQQYNQSPAIKRKKDRGSEEGLLQQLIKKENNSTATTAVKMTIEVPEMSPPPAALPVLRINSVNIDDPLLDSSQFIISSSSSDGEDFGLDSEPIFTDSDVSSNHDGQLVRRDSDTSDVSSTDGSAIEDGQSNDEDIAPEIAARIINQVENMFSDDHLAKDGFLLKHVRRRSDGFVSLKLVAGLRKVKQISRDFPVIMTALRKSEKLEVNSEGTKIRRVDSLTSHLKALPIASQNNKDNQKDKLSKSPTSSGDDLPGRNANGTCLHFSCGFPVTIIEKENKRQFGGKNGKVTRNNTNNKEFGGQKDQQHKQVNRPSYNNSANNAEGVVRRRGGSLPIAMVGPGPMHQHQQNHQFSQYHHQAHHQQSQPGNARPVSYLLPNSASPPSHFLQARPKSNSYCEGLMTSSTMSPWLQRRKAASRTNSDGNVIISSVIRQPRGPDGTKGFAAGPRPILVQ